MRIRSKSKHTARSRSLKNIIFVRFRITQGKIVTITENVLIREFLDYVAI